MAALRMVVPLVRPLSVSALDDRTPGEAIKTPDGLEKVKFLLRTYAPGELQQAKGQHRLGIVLRSPHIPKHL